jgi:hypothetical protein
MNKSRLLSILLIMFLPCLISLQDTHAVKATAQTNRRKTQQKKVMSPGANESTPPTSNRLFVIRSLGNRCVDVGGEQWWAVGAPVYIYPCNGSLAQQIRVAEIDFSHDVTMRTANSSFCLGVAVAPGNPIEDTRHLELQVCDGTPRQRFALDGDSIMVGKQAQGQRVSREFVIETAGKATPERTRLVTAVRDVSDAQYFSFTAVDGSSARPTTGFVSVSDEAALDLALMREWGAVIEIARSITLTRGAKRVPEGVTIRGWRKFTDNGPEIYLPEGAQVPCESPTQLCGFILQNNSRITSLRLRGPSQNPGGSQGILMRDDGGKFTNVTIDHIDASNWTDSAIHVAGAYGYLWQLAECCGEKTSTCDDWYSFYPSAPKFTYPRPTPVKILGNIIHNNPTYGVLIDAGANPLIRGNNLFWHQHSVSADAHPSNGYIARDNLITRWIIPGQNPKNNQVFDVHGTGQVNGTQGGGGWGGGIGGDLFDIGWNTILSAPHPNFRLRGTPCTSASFHENVSVQGPSSVQTETPDITIVQWGNKFNVPDPIDKLDVGDFDGDGYSDIFLATGVTWWYSSGGRSEWRFLNRIPYTPGALRFGDFDGDRRTDVLTVNAAGNIVISWAGTSWWTQTTATAQTINDIAVGNFDGDDRDDVFIADGAKWTYAAGAAESKYIAQSNLRPVDLRFGDFNNDGKTDIFFVSGNDWRIIKGGGNGTSEFLRYALTPNVQGMVVADFDGDSYADIARDVGSKWMYSARGLGGFITLRPAPSGQKIADRYVGRFDNDKKADVIVWDSVWFAIAPGNGNPVAKISWQGMR